jgi:predicted phosphodiesterase
MRIAILSDIHGNRTAFDAVLADLRRAAPDIVYHGGDLADNGSSPGEIIDQIRDLGWKGVLGNTDEVHTRPESLEEFASRSSAPSSLWGAVHEMASFTGRMLGGERIAWLGTLPRVLVEAEIAIVHASPESPWRSPTADAPEEELLETYAPLDRPIVVYGHIHRSFIRQLSRPAGSLVVINSGSVSLSYDGDPRAAYVLIDGTRPIIQRVEYDVGKEIKALNESGIPHADWIARSLCSGSPQLP